MKEQKSMKELWNFSYDKGRHNSFIFSFFYADHAWVMSARSFSRIRFSSLEM